MPVQTIDTVELIMVREGNMSLSDVFSATDISILTDFSCSY